LEARGRRKNILKILDKKFSLTSNYKLKLNSAFKKIRVITMLAKDISKKKNSILNIKNNQKVEKVENDRNNFLNRSLGLNKDFSYINNNIIADNSDMRLNHDSNNNKRVGKKIIIEKKKKGKFYRDNDIIEIYLEDFFKVENTYNITFEAKTIKNLIKKRFYVFKTGEGMEKLKNNTARQNFHYEILSMNVYSNKRLLSFRKMLKLILMSSLFCYIWYLDLIFIQDIYQKYWNNIIKILLYPFLITLLVKNLITQNLIILINTIIIFNYGKYITNYNKKNLFIKILLSIFVSQSSIDNYIAIDNYQQFFNK